MTTRILVVDDEPGIRAVLREYLGADGHEVMEAGTGGEALRLFEQTPADLVLLDVGLPDIDGLDVLRLLRQRSEVHVILVTARVEEVDKLVGLQMGADDYITKPFSPREVAARVKTVMRRSLRQAQGSYGVSPGPYGASQGAFGAPAAQPGPRIDGDPAAGRGGAQSIAHQVGQDLRQSVRVRRHHRVPPGGRGRGRVERHGHRCRTVRRGARPDLRALLPCARCTGRRHRDWPDDCPRAGGGAWRHPDRRLGGPGQGATFSVSLP